ncbi:MAG: hypothetical protein JEZ07_04405 [Phycisphaerae bacterium]|nr:hypothetical protein [Phycisphaerae bacterium]
MKMFRIMLVIGLLANLSLVSKVSAELYGGIEFPHGIASFADVVLSYDNMYSGGPAPTAHLDPTDALGIPQGSSSDFFITLGRGGKIELGFVDNFLVNSGDDLADVHVFEVGSDVEDTFVALRPTPETAALLGDPALYDSNNDGYYEVGKVFGATSSLDIDAIFTGFAANTLVFDAVQLIDDPNEGGQTGTTVGADIDAVGAIGSVRACDYDILGDINGDCKVDLIDFSLLASNWLLDCKVTPDDAGCVPID